MVVRSALVALVLVVVDEPADIEALITPLAGNPDVVRAKDPLISSMYCLRIGEEVVVELVLEV